MTRLEADKLQDAENDLQLRSPGRSAEPEKISELSGLMDDDSPSGAQV